MDDIYAYAEILKLNCVVKNGGTSDIISQCLWVLHNKNMNLKPFQKRGFQMGIS